MTKTQQLTAIFLGFSLPIRRHYQGYLMKLIHAAEIDTELALDLADNPPGRPEELRERGEEIDAIMDQVKAIITSTPE